jgi:hypothetical protein
LFYVDQVEGDDRHALAAVTALQRQGVRHVRQQRRLDGFNQFGKAFGLGQARQAPASASLSRSAPTGTRRTSPV